MKLRTILFFGIVALVFSLPMLKSANHGNKQNQNSFQSIPSTFDAYGNAVAQQPKKTQGFLSRLFGGSDEANDSSFLGATGQINDSFQLVNQSPNSFSNGSSIPTQKAGFQSQQAFSEPVYPAFFNLGEFLNFDVTPNWIQSKWPRVSIVQGPDQLTGMRVPLVSGPRPVDIHGSLTYFFDSQQRVQRICFKGWTGDSKEIVQLVERMGFTRKKSNAAGYFVQRHWGKMKGVLRVDYPPVIRREFSTEQLMLLFEFVNPSSRLSVSAPTQTILTAMENGR